MDMTTERDHGDEICDNLTSKYELRPQSRNLKNGFTTTWIDQDETGDYDPSEELRKQRACRARARLRSRKVGVPVTEDISDGSVNGRAASGEQPRLIAQIIFKSEMNKAAFKECVKDWPVTSDAELDTLLNGYILQSRPAGNSYRPHGSHDDERPRHVPSLPDDLTGHPIARGCWECLSLGQRCPLLDDEHAWPCLNCIADDHDCDLVTPPTKKRACERCKRRGEDCSYTHTKDHSRACQQCDNEGYRCVAGPAEGSVRSRIRLGRDVLNVPPPPPKKEAKTQEIWTCMQCREAGRQCSFSIGGYGDDCVACEMNGNICFPERTLGVPQAFASNERQKKRRQDMIEYQPPPPKRAKKTVDRGTKQTITTKFCHPIAFNHEDPNGDKPCHFCDGTAFPLLGLEPRKVKVVDWSDGRGLHEVSGGYASKGKEQTRMCLPCTMDRAAIITCEKHHMRPIPGVSSNTLDYDGALTAIYDENLTRKNDQWCSLCLDLATHECVAPQAEDIGCGLALCGQCVAGMKGGDLQAAIGRVEREDRALGVRADLDLLKKDGLLMRFVMWVSGH